MTEDWAPERIWLQRGMGDEGSHTWCADQIGEDSIGDSLEEAEYVRADVALARVAQLEGWHQAVLEACMVRECCYDSTDPAKSLRLLLDWEVQTALDPAVSDVAQALVDRGREDGELAMAAANESAYQRGYLDGMAKGRRDHG